MTLNWTAQRKKAAKTATDSEIEGEEGRIGRVSHPPTQSNSLSINQTINHIAGRQGNKGEREG